MSTRKFTKPPLSVVGQMRLLESRGLVINDRDAAGSKLHLINYYRFCGYALHYEEFIDGVRQHVYKPDTSFEQVIELATFDSKLRNILLRYIEPVELAFRTALCYQMAMVTKDPFWYLDTSLFLDHKWHVKYLRKCEREVSRSAETFIDSYKLNYDEPVLPPCWMMTEIMALGSLSVLYDNLNEPDHAEAVAGQLGTSHYFLGSWIHVVTVLRNICAHQGRLWNRQLKIKPRFPKSIKKISGNPAKLKAQITALAQLLKVIGQEENLENEVQELLAENQEIPTNKTGY